MAIKYITTTIPETDTLKWGTNDVTVVMHGNDVVWRKLTEVTRTFGNHTYRDKNGSPYEGWHAAWGPLDLGQLTRITNVYLGVGTQTGSGAPLYRVYANTTNSTSGWTLLSEFRNTSAGWKSISNANMYRYVWLSMNGASDVRWIEDEGGNYYWYIAYDFRVKGLKY